MECRTQAQHLVSICPVEVKTGVLDFQRMDFVAHFYVGSWWLEKSGSSSELLGTGKWCVCQCKLQFPAVFCIVSELNLAGYDRRNCCDWN